MKVVLRALLTMAMTVVVLVGVQNVAEAESPMQQQREAIAAPTLPATPSVTARYCWSWLSGHGLCIKYSRADLQRFEAIGLISGSVAAAFAAEEMCGRVPARYKALCKAAVAGALTETVVVLRTAQTQRRCVEVRASLNPISALFERARVVNC